MKRYLFLSLLFLALSASAKEKWPDGTVVDPWFENTQRVDIASLGKKYVLTDYGVIAGWPRVQTKEIQAVIDRCAQEGGGVVVVPTGTFVSGALFFRQGTHLWIEEGGMLKGSDRIIDYPILDTRFEGESCKYFSAFINADGLDGFTIGGKGTWADKDESNGPCERIMIQNCRYGRVHGCLTLGSEAIHCRNIILRNCTTERADRVLWLKMRPDTPQHYEYVLVEGIKGACGRFLFVHPWTQFFKMGDRKDMPLSRCNNITMRNISVKTETMFDVKTSDKYSLEEFSMDGKTLSF